MSYRYIGNKAKIASTILDYFSEHLSPGAVVADLMCGTAAFSAALRSAGYTVVASDIMTFAVHHARVRLLLSGAPSFGGLGLSYSEALDILNNLQPEMGLFWREYAPLGQPASGVPPRKYFSAQNAAKIDAIRTQIRVWLPLLTALESALLHHDLILAANRVANIAGTYGHFRSSWSPNSEQPIELRQSSFLQGGTGLHRVLQGPVELVAGAVNADACYLDPPYMKRQYAANYHILETLARGDHPIPVGVSGLRMWRDQYSDFCSRRKIGAAFEAVFRSMDCRLFFISYSEDGLLNPGAMYELLSDFGAVRRFEFPHQRFKSNAGGLGGTVAEHLYVVDVS